MDQRILRDLAAADLAGARRVAFYAFGAAEGLFDLEPHYAGGRLQVR